MLYFRFLKFSHVRTERPFRANLLLGEFLDGVYCTQRKAHRTNKTEEDVNDDRSAKKASSILKGTNEHEKQEYQMSDKAYIVSFQHLSGGCKPSKHEDISQCIFQLCGRVRGDIYVFFPST